MTSNAMKILKKSENALLYKNFKVIYSTVFSSQVVTVPDRRSRVLEVVIVRRLISGVLGIRRGEGLGRG
jgi:hypothetical protein